MPLGNVEILLWRVVRHAETDGLRPILAVHRYPAAGWNDFFCYSVLVFMAICLMYALYVQTQLLVNSEQYKKVREKVCSIFDWQRKDPPISTFENNAKSPTGLKASGPTVAHRQPAPSPTAAFGEVKAPGETMYWKVHNGDVGASLMYLRSLIPEA